MILNDEPNEKVTLSNVGKVTEFNIKATAHSFRILSSGLYSNKIRAIIRELSCNALDAMVAAGRGDVPFEVHLPTAIEPWFSVKDTGIGLSADDVERIASTYFESTKRDSNKFIGALGLGSKSPFSYTDNYSLIAIKDGIKNTYAAFISDDGIPATALMATESTNDHSGVEIKFNVNDTRDFIRFKQEALYVFTYFDKKPIVTGYGDFQFTTVEYREKDITPGVSQYVRSNNFTKAYAVMGNIAYPIEMPNAETNLGELQYILNNKVEIKFDIGELDFNPSREALNYSAQTINAIKQKLESIRDSIALLIEEKVKSIENLWEIQSVLSNYFNNSLYTASVSSFIAKSDSFRKFFSNGVRKEFEVTFDELSKYNIKARSFTVSSYKGTINDNKPCRRTIKDTNGNHVLEEYFDISMNKNTFFIVNNSKIGGLERAKYHFRRQPHGVTVFLLEPLDIKCSADFKGFLNYIYSPGNVLDQSELIEKPKETKSSFKNISILKMIHTSYNSRTGRKQSWAEGGKLSEFSSTETYYYIPLKGFEVESAYGLNSAYRLFEAMKNCGISSLSNINLYGVRKSDIETIKKLTNWINIEDYIVGVLKGLPPEPLIKSHNLFNNYSYFSHDMIINSISSKLEKESSFKKVCEYYSKYNGNSFRNDSVKFIYKLYNNNTEVDSTIEIIKKELAETNKKYPLLQYISFYSIKPEAVVDYIKLIDKQHT